MTAEAAYARRLLGYYLRTAWEAAGAGKWTSDNDAEVDAIVDDLLDAVRSAADKPVPAPTRPAGFDTELRVPGERRILRLGDVVAVKPSRPKKRDGWRGVITKLDADRGEVTVTKPGECSRTVAVARIGARKGSR